jgi:predicted nucleic acid-binding protein
MMISEGFGLDSATSAGLLVDTNLLVLYAVGTVNRNRIETFKRTRQYTKADYDLLVRVLRNFDPLYTVAHVLAEVSNLTDLPGAERLQARLALKETISVLNEAEMPSTRAAEDRLYQDLGLVDAAIGAVARAHNCAVLTDDKDLYLRLSHDNLNVFNFTHVRARAWGI